MTYLCMRTLELITARTKVPGNYYLASSEWPDQARNGYLLRQHANHHHFVVRTLLLHIDHSMLSSVYVHGPPHSC